MDENELKAQIDAAVEAAVEGLKNTNRELKGEKTALAKKLEEIQGQLDKFGGLDLLKEFGSADDLKSLADMRKRLSADETGKLLAEGRYDEWFDNRTAAMRKDHDNQLRQMQEQMAEMKQRAEKWETAHHDKVLETDVASAVMETGVEPSALVDVQLRAKTAFKFDAEKGRMVLRDAEGGVVYGKDGKSPLTIKEWLEGQKETSRHWWPPSKGGGANGSDPGSQKREDLGKMDFRDYAAKRREQGFKAF